jgi:signal transduction histidine kinase
MSTRFVLLLMRPNPPRVALGIVLAASFIAVESIVVVLLHHVTAQGGFDVVFLLGVLVVSTVWGMTLAITTSVASAIAFECFRSWPPGHLWPAQTSDVVVTGVFLTIALLANSLAGLARARTVALQASHDELIASRSRIVAAADDARRKLERDLHDGAQQRLVSLGLQLRTAESSVPPELIHLKDSLGQVVSGLAGLLNDLQEISRGIHPAILSNGGLGPALKTLARRCTVPVVVDVAVDRHLPDSVEVAAYYVVAEALTNAAKHADAAEMHVWARADGNQLHLSVRDDGIGGAEFGRGSGLVGLKDRVEALGGRMEVRSPAGSGTSLNVAIPLGVVLTKERRHQPGEHCGDAGKHR